MNKNIEVRPPSGLLSLPSLWKNLLDLVFPPRCEHCGRVDVGWCATCSTELQQYPLSIRTRDIPDIEQVFATGDHEGILRDAIHALKYTQQRHLANALGERLSVALDNLNLGVDALVAVPSHANRQAKRGYNQSIELCDVVSQLSDIPFNPQALTRVRDTRSQVGLTQAERLVNVEDAFRPTTAFHGDTLLLIDDVCTTGATLSACARSLKEAGAISVYALTLAAAIH
jgi:ComF family protein